MVVLMGKEKPAWWRWRVRKRKIKGGPRGGPFFFPMCCIPDWEIDDQWS